MNSDSLSLSNAPDLISSSLSLSPCSSHLLGSAALPQFPYSQFLIELPTCLLIGFQILLQAMQQPHIPLLLRAARNWSKISVKSTSHHVLVEKEQSSDILRATCQLSFCSFQLSTLSSGKAKHIFLQERNSSQQHHSFSGKRKSFYNWIFSRKNYLLQVDPSFGVRNEFCILFWWAFSSFISRDLKLTTLDKRRDWLVDSKLSERPQAESHCSISGRWN